jgi:hypothetical protein
MRKAVDDDARVDEDGRAQRAPTGEFDFVR